MLSRASLFFCNTLGTKLLICVGALVLLGVALSGPVAQAQTAKLPATVALAPTKPLWSELTALQQTALKPLETHWDFLTESHKRRWLALSRNYFSLSAEEQHTLHGRMTEWSALSGRERVQARLNFAEVKQLAPNERKAKWEAYQALSEEDKRKLADNAPLRPRSTAVPVRPVPAQKLVQVPTPPRKGEHAPRIELAPPVLTTPPVTVVPAPVPAPVIPMVRMTEQPSSAP